MPTDITPDELEQIQQTIDMFELIAETNPDDYQSLNLLRDAYAKLDKDDEVERIDLALGRAYIRLGQFQASSARLEALIARNPSNKEALDLLEEAKAGVKEMTVDIANGSSEADAIALDFEAAAGSGSGLIEMQDTTPAGSAQGAGATIELPDDDGNEPLAKFLLSSDIISAERIGEALERTRQKNEALEAMQIGASLLSELKREASEEEMDGVYNAVIERCNIGLVPLSYYDVDRQILQMLPAEMTLGRGIVPFDLISRTIMIAMVNPFDAPAKMAVQASLDYHILWYFATPESINKVLTDGYRLNAG